MLNEEKVRYMTELAIFEKNEGKKIFPINRYFKKDYVFIYKIIKIHLRCRKTEELVVY